METVKCENLSFSYPGKTIFENISFSLSSGEILLLYGENGCGKTTLINVLTRLLCPKGNLSGSIYINGKDALDDASCIKDMAWCPQDASSAVVCDNVYDELVFSLKNKGLDENEISSRAADICSVFPLSHLLEKTTSELSDGQRSMLALSSAVITSPSLLLLDEPCANLDPAAASDFKDLLSKLVKTTGMSVILATHNTALFGDICDRFLILPYGLSGNMETFDGVCGEKGIITDRSLCGTVLSRCLKTEKTDLSDILSLYGNRLKKPHIFPDEYALELKNVSFAYSKKLPDTLSGADLKLVKGACTALTGANGSGKTTLLKICAGMLEPHHGKKLCKTRAVYVPSELSSFFIKSTLSEDIEYFLKITGKDMSAAEKIYSEFPVFERLGKCMDSNPYDLSGGEMRLAALFKALLTGADILLLDEPTAGLDAYSRIELCRLIHTLEKEGITFAISSHDFDFCICASDFACVVFRKTVQAYSGTQEVLSARRFSATESIKKICSSEAFPFSVREEDYEL